MNATAPFRLRSFALLAGLLLAASGASAAVCLDSAGTWKNASLPAQTGLFTVEFDATPGAAGMDGVSGVSYGAASGYAALAKRHGARVIEVNPDETPVSGICDATTSAPMPAPMAVVVVADGVVYVACDGKLTEAFLTGNLDAITFPRTKNVCD